VTTSDIALAMARAGHAPGLSGEHLLHELTTVAAGMLPGCCGASISIWLDGRIVGSALSHVDLAALRHLPRPVTEDPERHALDHAEAVSIPDTLTPGRWAGFAAAAAAFGIRSLAIWPVPAGPRATFGFYATAPRAFEDATLAVIAGQAGAVLREAEYHDELLGEAHRLRASLRSRSVIDQAIGIIVAERRCTPADALADLQRLSQSGNVRMADLATELIGQHSPG
jgi:hypothetical protein